MIQHYNIIFGAPYSSTVKFDDDTCDSKMEHMYSNFHGIILK